MFGSERLRSPESYIQDMEDGSESFTSRLVVRPTKVVLVTGWVYCRKVREFLLIKRNYRLRMRRRETWIKGTTFSKSNISIILLVHFCTLFSHKRGSTRQKERGSVHHKRTVYSPGVYLVLERGRRIQRQSVVRHLPGKGKVWQV